MNTRRRVLLGSWLGSWLLLGGCSTHVKTLSDLPVGDYAGHYIAGDKASWFRPCGTAATAPAWWVTFTGRAVAQLEQARANGRFVDGKSFFVSWKASLTTGGEVGPRGRGAPALLVHELYDLGLETESDCTGDMTMP